MKPGVLHKIETSVITIAARSRNAANLHSGAAAPAMRFEQTLSAKEDRQSRDEREDA